MTAARRTVSLKPRVLVALTAAAACLFFLALPQMFEVSTAAIKIDMKVSDGLWVELYLNDLTREPARQPVVPGERRIYTFAGIYEDITILRIDPTSVPGAEIELYGVSVEDSGGLVRRFDPAAIARWTTVNVGAPIFGAGFVRFEATTNDPILQTTEHIQLPRTLPAFVSGLVHGIQEPKFVLQIVIIAFGLLLLFALFDRARLPHVAIAIVILAITVAFVPVIVSTHHALAPIHTTVGRAGFFGLSAGANRLATGALLVAAIVVAVSGYWLSTRFSRGRGAEKPAADESRQPAAPHGQRWSKAKQLVTPAVVFALLALVFFPNVDGMLHNMMSRVIEPNWDGNNVVVWAYLAHEGYLPLRDYWYPYAGHYVFDRPAPAGFLYATLFRLITISGFFYVIYSISGRKLLLALFCVAAVVVGDALQVFWGATRYLLSVTIALAYLSVDQEKNRLQAGHAWFWLLCCVALFVAPVQVVYAAPGVAAKLILDIIQTWPVSWLRLARRLLREFAVPAVFLLCYLFILAINGQLAGFVEFFLGLDDVAKASAAPTDFVGAIGKPFGIKFVILVAPFLFLALGLFERLRRPGMSNRLADFLILLGLIGFMILQKHLVRPMDWQMFIVPALGVFGYAVLWKGRRSPAEHVILGGIVGAYIAVMVYSGAVANYGRDLAGGPARLIDGFSLVLEEDGLIEEANAKRFGPQRFVRFQDELEVVSRIRNASPDGALPRIFVLGDSAILYILFRQLPPYHVNDYNASPIYEQRKVAKWLRREKPVFVIWNPNDTTFDYIQRFVRNPLIYNTVVESYLPHDVVGRFEILRRREPSEPVPVAYWHETLGPAAHFGHFARASSFPRFDPCEGDQPEQCQDFLKVEIIENDVAGSRVTIPFEAGGSPFEVTFETVPGESLYYVSLDRIWFWGTLKRTGYSPRLAIEKLPPGVKAEIVPRATRPEILY